MVSHLSFKSDLLTLSHLGDLKRSIPEEGGGFTPPPPLLFFSAVIFDMIIKLGNNMNFDANNQNHMTKSN